MYWTRKLALRTLSVPPGTTHNFFERMIIRTNGTNGRKDRTISACPSAVPTPAHRDIRDSYTYNHSLLF